MEKHIGIWIMPKGNFWEFWEISKINTRLWEVNATRLISYSFVSGFLNFGQELCASYYQFSNLMTVASGTLFYCKHSLWLPEINKLLLIYKNTKVIFYN